MNNSDHTDESLVMLTLAGEKEAYELLVTRHQNAVVSQALSVTHNRDMAEDAAQDAFVTAWLKLDTLKDLSKYRAWVMMIVKNCAKNMVARYRSYVDIDEAGEMLRDISGISQTDSPYDIYETREEAARLHGSIDSLPERVKKIIKLYYFDNLSVGEIAAVLSVSPGTVKAQLHDGRNKIRRDLSSADEKQNDSLKEKVMKKIEELKLWHYKNCKNGFEEFYREVLEEAEQLPEGADKSHALADVLMRGWWWLPSGRNDDLWARIREAAINGRNDDVMKYIEAVEAEKLWQNARAAYIKDVQIPELEKHGFREALGDAHYRLAREYFEDNKPDEGKAEIEKALGFFARSDIEYALAVKATEINDAEAARYKDIRREKYLISGIAAEIRNTDSELRRFKTVSCFRGGLEACDWGADFIFENAAQCDGYFTKKGIKAGETFPGSGKNTLKYVSDNARTGTPAGDFTGCRVWEATDGAGGRTVTWYKEGVGIVRQEKKKDGFTETRVLAGYKVCGEGLIPLKEGNEWHYTAETDPDIFPQKCSYKVVYAGKGRAILSGIGEMYRMRYDENSWQDMIQQMTCEYFRHTESGDTLADVSHAVERAEALARTKAEKAHTKAAASVMRRIMEPSPVHWNFFGRRLVSKDDGKISFSEYNGRWSFEWKSTNSDLSCIRLLYNNIFGILQDTVGCVMSDEWVKGAELKKEFLLWESYCVTAEIKCADGGSVLTPAGRFDNCLKVTTHVSGLTGGLDYYNGTADHYYCEGIGIVRVVRQLYDGAAQSVYELTSYEGTGEGFMPVCDGLVRRYEATDMTDGYIGSAEYTFTEDEDGQILCFSDRCGVRKTQDIITSYGAVIGEITEKNLWASGRYDESRLRFMINNLNLVMFTVTRPFSSRGPGNIYAAWHGYCIKMLKNLGNGTVPAAFAGIAASKLLTQAAAMLSHGPESDYWDKGFAALDECFELTRIWTRIPDGELLDVGDELFFAGIKLIKGTNVIVLPDGTKEIMTGLSDIGIWGISKESPYNAMTAEHGWEWFDPARGSERFAEYVKKAKALRE